MRLVIDDVRPAWFGVAAGMVVDEDQRGRPDIQPPADHLARMDRRLVDRSVADMMVEDQPVARIEVENADPLDRQVGHVDRQVIEQRLPAAEHRLLAYLGARHAAGGDRDRVQRGGAGRADALDPA